MFDIYIYIIVILHYIFIYICQTTLKHNPLNFSATNPLNQYCQSWQVIVATLEAREISENFRAHSYGPKYQSQVLKTHHLWNVQSHRNNHLFHHLLLGNDHNHNCNVPTSDIFRQGSSKTSEVRMQRASAEVLGLRSYQLKSN